MPSIWWPRQMPKVGMFLSMIVLMTGTAYSPVAAGPPVPHPRRLVPGEALARGHHRHQVHPDQTRPFACFFLQCSEIELAVAGVRDHRVRHSLGPNEAGQRTGIDAGQPDHAPRLEPV